MHTDVIYRLHDALPKIRDWIDQLLEAHWERARPIASLGFSRLASYYPPEVLASANVVSVDRTPFPPVALFGLRELASHAELQFGGITFKNTFFIARGAETEALCFHELVHVIQWARLGVDRFLLAYALGLVRDGYEGSPLEMMAYCLQHRFERGDELKELVQNINESTDTIWAETATLLSGAVSP